MVNAADAYLKAVGEQDRNASLCFMAASDIVRCLAPICPHWGEELWHEQLHRQGSIYNASWPEFDPEATKANVVELAVQICGKVRCHIDVEREAPKEELEAKALEAAAKWLDGKQVVKVVAISRAPREHCGEVGTAAEDPR